MRYQNAKDVFPEELLELLQEYYQGGYLYIPMKEKRESEERNKTNYKMELEKRNQHIFLKYLEGWTNAQLAVFYHLSESSIRRIVLTQRRTGSGMAEKIRNIIFEWGMTVERLIQKYPSVWEVNDFYMIKVYDDKVQLERNIRVLSHLYHCEIPVAEIVRNRYGQEYTEAGEQYYLMTKKLEGNNISDIHDLKLAYQMGKVIGRLHQAFRMCENEMAFWNNSLLDEMQGWVRQQLCRSGWSIVPENEYLETLENLEACYGQLPKQLIHRDVHFGNFLFSNGNFTGYIDFDLSQSNIKIFDLCYFLTGLLTQESGMCLNGREWLRIVQHVVTGYESTEKLLQVEKDAMPCVMKSIELLFAAYFLSTGDQRGAEDAVRIFRLVQRIESELRSVF